MYRSMLKAIIERLKELKFLSSAELSTLKYVQGFLSVGTLIAWRSFNWFVMETC